MGYWLYMKQEGNGCDYTIGCGEKLIDLGTDDLPTAQAKAREHIEYHGLLGNNDDRTLMICKLFFRAYNLMPELLKWKAERRDRDLDLERQAKLKDKERELEELKAEIDRLKGNQ